MRKIVITRGHPGSGKSHALKMAGLANWTLSSDHMRLMFAAPFLTTDGRLILNQDMNHKAFNLLNKLAEERMERGETIAIDSTLIERGTLEEWYKLAKKHRYQIALLDMSTIPLETAILHNEGRTEDQLVPDFVIKRMYTKLKEAGVRDGLPDLHIIEGKEDSSHIQELKDWVKEPISDFTGKYENIIHIGDVQGCYTVLAGSDGPLKNGFKDENLYIFVGDLLDRGIENGKVMRWFVDEALHRDNVILLWGNHELHLHKWARSLPHVSNEFEHRTLPQLLEAGITQSDAEAVCHKAKEYLHYTHHEAEVLVTHAGLSTFPDNPHLISLHQLSHGTGYWTDPVDQQFERNSSRGFQVHGHRNNGHVGIRATKHSFNLEDGVESGGNLRTCTLNATGWTTAEYRNPIFKPLKDRIASETMMSAARVKSRKILPHWILENDGKDTKIDLDSLNEMLNHPGVKTKSNDKFPHVYSLNFTKKVFFDRSWDDVVVKARGLFINGETNEIVARGYDKFFNVNERDETTIANLSASLKFPAISYEKYNGFLGNIGYDSKTDTLFISSKSTPEGDFADYFLAIIRSTLNDTQLENLRRYLRDTEASMTFEVIDPINDPHMIAYPEPKIVLLDIIRRTSEFEKATHDVVTAVGSKFGIETKKKAIVFKNATQLASWYKSASNDMNYKIGGEHLEGLVIEDTSGFMTKVKLPYYAFWKQMRGMKDRMASAQIKDKPFEWTHTRRADGTPPTIEEQDLAHNFRDWCLSKDYDTLKQDIITLRDAYEIEMDSCLEPRMAHQR